MPYLHEYLKREIMGISGIPVIPMIIIVTGYILQHGDSLYFLWGKNLQCSYQLLKNFRRKYCTELDHIFFNFYNRHEAFSISAVFCGPWYRGHWNISGTCVSDLSLAASSNVIWDVNCIIFGIGTRSWLGQAGRSGPDRPGRSTQPGQDTL